MNERFSSVKFWLSANVALFLFFLLHLFGAFQTDIEQFSYLVFVNVSVGGLLSFFFYWLVVRIPENKRRLVIKSNSQKWYRALKKDILYSIIFASQTGGRSDLRADSETINRLMTVQGFREAFSGGVQANEGYYAFVNVMDPENPQFKAIISTLGLMERHIRFILSNYIIDDEEAFDFLRRLEAVLFSLSRSSAGEEDSASLCRFVYEFFAGWSFAEGYRDHDIVERVLQDI